MLLGLNSPSELTLHHCPWGSHCQSLLICTGSKMYLPSWKQAKMTSSSPTFSWKHIILIMVYCFTSLRYFKDNSQNSPEHHRIGMSNDEHSLSKLLSSALRVGVYRVCALGVSTYWLPSPPQMVYNKYGWINKHCAEECTVMKSGLLVWPPCADLRGIKLFKKPILG